MFLAAFAKALSRLLASITLYAAPCLSTGALLAAFHQLLHLDFSTAFALGFFAAVAPVFLTYASNRGMRRTLTDLKQWRTTGLISQAEYDRLRRAALRWYRIRRFGK